MQLPWWAMKLWPPSALLLAVLASPMLHGQSHSDLDSDRDGLSDALEDALLQQFRPTLMVSADDCSALPARFASDAIAPTAVRDDGTLYGQAFPRQGAPSKPRQIELHFYHLWRRDCGRLGHPLDAEHVAVLLQAEAGALLDEASAWTAVYWYAAAHEDTVCDASQVTRASTLEATAHGATVWISSGKHASFLTEELCHHGCGGDSCVRGRAISASAVINLGEAAHPAAGANWIYATQWPLQEKMTRTDFPTERLRRLEALPMTDIAWANPAKRPAQAAILGGNATVDATLHGGEVAAAGLSTGGHATGSALATGSRSTDTAISLAGQHTSGALGKAGRATRHGLGKALHGVEHGLGKKFRPNSDKP